MRTPPIVKNLLIANCIIFLATMLIPAFDSFSTQFLALWGFNTPLFHIHQFLTYMFLHANFEHLFFNMFALWMFGRMLEYEIGSSRFLTYYLVCGVGAALIQCSIALLSGEQYFCCVGASGAVMGLLLAFGVMHPNEKLFIIPIPIPIKAKWFVIGYAVIELLCGMRGFDAGVAHFAHIGGMLWGLILLYYWKNKGKIYF